MAEKTKIFLESYIDVQNAQNLNCLSLCKYLNHEKYEIYTMTLNKKNILNQKNVKLFTLFYPYRFSRFIAYFWGIFHCDIGYFPKREYSKWTKFLLKLFNKKSFTTVEIILDDRALENSIKKRGSREKVFDSYNVYSNIYAITGFVKRYNEKHGLKFCDRILPLGTEIKSFTEHSKRVERLENIVLIGNDLIRKGIYEYFELAKAFPELTFHIVGTGNGKIDVSKEVNSKKITNIIYHGGLNHTELKKLLKKIDLHILPSRSEGFPKVTLETAAAGVPSLVYSDYGAEEWITHGKDGYVVDTLEQMKEVVSHLQEKPQELAEVSKNAIEMAKRFDWQIVIREWEKEIEKLYHQ